MINNKILEIKNIFEIFDNPMDKYMQIIEMGKKNKGLNSEFKNNENRIFGCTSLAWIHTTKKNNLYYIDIDSDTFIVKGLLSILQYIVNGTTKEELLKIEIKDILKNIGLEESITSQRTNGFLSAMNKIKGQININE